MRSRAYDYNEVVHLAPWKGAQIPACCGEGVTDEELFLSPMFLPAEVPLTCVKCIAIETMLKQQADADARAEDDV